jgi:hypothetical protein
MYQSTALDFGSEFQRTDAVKFPHPFSAGNTMRYLMVCYIVFLSNR